MCGAVIAFYLSNEGVSILENAAHLGLPLQEKLKLVTMVSVSTTLATNTILEKTGYPVYGNPGICIT